MLRDYEKLSIVFDSSMDQKEIFPEGYYIVILLKWNGKEWYNSGYVTHLKSLNDLESWLETIKGRK